MNYLIIDSDQYNYTQNKNGMFYAIPILSGPYKGKFAAFENMLELFPEIFSEVSYQTDNLTESDFKYNTTPPASYGYGVIIPVEMQLPFESDLFELDGFEIPLQTVDGMKVVDICYFMWQDFRDALDRKGPDGSFVHKYLKRALMPLWDYVALKITNKEVVPL